MVVVVVVVGMTRVIRRFCQPQQNCYAITRLLLKLLVFAPSKHGARNSDQDCPSGCNVLIFYPSFSSVFSSSGSVIPGVPSLDKAEALMRSEISDFVSMIDCRLDSKNRMSKILVVDLPVALCQFQLKISR